MKSRAFHYQSRLERISLSPAVAVECPVVIKLDQDLIKILNEVSIEEPRLNVSIRELEDLDSSPTEIIINKNEFPETDSTDLDKTKSDASAVTTQTIGIGNQQNNPNISYLPSHDFMCPSRSIVTSEKNEENISRENLNSFSNWAERIQPNLVENSIWNSLPVNQFSQNAIRPISKACSYSFNLNPSHIRDSNLLSTGSLIQPPTQLLSVEARSILHQDPLPQ